MSAVLSTAARPLMRRSALKLSAGRTAARRLESTGSTADKAKEVASKSSQGLSRVASAAGPALAGAAKGVSSAMGALGRIGGRTGRLIAFVERQVPFVVYYSRVGLELGKIVFQGQKMSPPSMATVQTYWQGLLRRVQNPSALVQSAGKTATQQPASILQTLRTQSPVTLAASGVLLAECIGFFTIGEMIGRFKVIGYHGETGAHH